MRLKSHLMKSHSKMLYQVIAPHFTAGFEVWDGVVFEAAPIIKYMSGWGIGKVRRYCVQKGWELNDVPSNRL